MTETNTRLGIWLMIGTSFVFAAQDALSRHLAAEYSVFLVVMIRYWFFAAFVIALAVRRSGSLRKAAATRANGALRTALPERGARGGQMGSLEA